MGPGREKEVDGEAQGLISALALILAICAVVQGWKALDNGSAVDFYQAWIAGQAVRRGWTDNVYSSQGRETIDRLALAQATDPIARYTAAARVVHRTNQGRMETNGTPLLFTVFGACFGGDFERDYFIYSLLSLAAYVGSIVVLGRLLVISWVGVLLGVTSFVAWFEPYRSELHVCNLNSIQLGLLTVFLWLAGKRRLVVQFLGGGVLGLLVMLKPNLLLVPVLVLALALVNRQVRRATALAGGMALGVAGSVAASAAFFGSARYWLDWLAIVPELLHPVYTVKRGNWSWATVVYETLGVETSGYLLAGLLVLFAMYAWQGRWRGSDRLRLRSDRLRLGAGGVAPEERGPHEAFLAVGVGTAIALLSARLVWVHYQVLMIPLALYCLRPVEAWERLRTPAAGARVWIGALALLGASSALIGLPFPPILPLRRSEMAVLTNLTIFIWLMLALFGLHLLGREPIPDRQTRGVRSAPSTSPSAPSVQGSLRARHPEP